MPRAEGRGPSDRRVDVRRAPWCRTTTSQAERPKSSVGTITADPVEPLGPVWIIRADPSGILDDRSRFLLGYINVERLIDDLADQLRLRHLAVRRQLREPLILLLSDVDLRTLIWLKYASH